MRIFGIGLSRTGTKSLWCAAKILGFKAIHYPLGILKEYKGKIVINQNSNLLKQYDAFFDTPITLCYRQIDKLFPNSKFILTVRDIDDWLKSCSFHFSKPVSTRRQKPAWWDNKINGIWDDSFPRIAQLLRLATYNCDLFSANKFREVYLRHLELVSDYFKSRPNDLLIFNVLDGWGSLCNFLGKDIPDVQFPKINIGIL